MQGAVDAERRRSRKASFRFLPSASGFHSPKKHEYLAILLGVESLRSYVLGLR